MNSNLVNKWVVSLLAIAMMLSMSIVADVSAASLLEYDEIPNDVVLGTHWQDAHGPMADFTLTTGMVEDRLVYFGVGGEIDGLVNPDLRVEVGSMVQVTLVNGDGVEHDIAFPDQNAHSEHVSVKDSRVMIAFIAGTEGSFAYYCTIPGHRQAGMEGLLIVGPEAQTAKPTATSGVAINRDPSDLPPALGDRPPTTVEVRLKAIELEATLADGTTYTYWTFDGKVPGPFIRIRVGDLVKLTLENEKDSKMVHSIDLHAVTGPGGGAGLTQVVPGEEKSFVFRALNPGLFVYHCATPMVAHHITNGMYGLILVEPENGLSKVDREYYVMQGELYTEQSYGQKGHLDFSLEKLLSEKPEYIVFNGAVGSLTGDHALRAEVGEIVRIFFGVGGPNLISSFHVIGEIFDRVYDQASLTAPPLTDVQTTLVPAGGATVVELGVQVPGKYVLVDHALSRAEKGLSGILVVDGPDAPFIFTAAEAE